MHKTTIYMPEALRRALDARAHATGHSRSDLIRRALRVYLEGGPRVLPASVARHRGGTFRASADEAELDEAWGAAPPS